MNNSECLICHEDFYTKPSHKEKGWGKYCSIKCRTQAQHNGQVFKCFICGKELYRSQKEILKSKSNNFFCSKSCQTKWRNSVVFIGEKHLNWKSGISAYRRIIKTRNNKVQCKLCKEQDERIITVHHVDNNRKNNKIDNLVYLCHNCHYLVHHYSEEKTKFMVTMV